ncbi:MAG TPA: hypothetical protein VFV38_10945 [Ktedonobacteraceae bacterium]|nr:hypothetical protein [Ktedonobacteraceae bacterium]
MPYKRVQPHTKEEAEEIFAQGTSEQICDALLGVTYYVGDWRWVQSACLKSLESSDMLVQEIAILCLGHLATFHRILDLAVVIPALQAHISQPELASALHRALDDIAFQVEDKSYFRENWGKLPLRIRETLIENKIFNPNGKFIYKGRRFAVK